MGAPAARALDSRTPWPSWAPGGIGSKMFLVQEPSPRGWPHPLDRGIISPTWSLGKLTKRTVWLMSKTLGPHSYQRDFGLVFSLPQFPLPFTNVSL